MKTKKKPPIRHRRTGSRKTPAAHVPQPFVEHLHELKRRIYFVVASVALWGGATYAVQQHVVNALLRPANGQHFIYTSPGGGIDFLFRICVYTGLILSTPVIVYNFLGFIEPMMNRASRRFILWNSFTCALLAIAGVMFGYFIGLPAALHFLFHQFTTVQIKPLVTIQSYLSFVIAYLLGSALIFQLPILLVNINRIKPLKPRRLLHYERWVILAAFVLAGLMNPTPNIFSQLLVAGPFILTYQVSILLIMLLNRPHKPTSAELLREKDAANQAQRQSIHGNLQPLMNPINEAPKQPTVLRTRTHTPRSYHPLSGNRALARMGTATSYSSSSQLSARSFMPNASVIRYGNPGRS